MRLGKRLKWFACGLIGLSAVSAFQRPFRQFEGVEYSIGDVPLPADYREKTEPPAETHDPAHPSTAETSESSPLPPRRYALAFPPETGKTAPPPRGGTNGAHHTPPFPALRTQSAENWDESHSLQ